MNEKQKTSMKTKVNAGVILGKAKNLSVFQRKGIYVLFLVAISSLHAGEVENLFTRANRAFASGQYADAIRDYETLASEEGFSASLLFNLANACFRDGKIGRAILNYERALVLDPHDADIEANLNLARKSSGLFAPELAWWERAVHPLSVNQWTWLVSGSFTLSCLGGILWLISKRRSWRVITILSLLVLLAAAACLGILWGNFDRAIVLETDTPVRIGPFDTATSSFALKAGEAVRIQNRHENFLFVRGGDGKSGWVSAEQIERVIGNR